MAVRGTRRDCIRDQDFLCNLWRFSSYLPNPFSSANATTLTAISVLAHCHTRCTRFSRLHSLIYLHRYRFAEKARACVLLDRTCHLRAGPPLTSHLISGSTQNNLSNSYLLSPTSHLPPSTSMFLQLQPPQLRRSTTSLPVG